MEFFLKPKLLTILQSIIPSECFLSKSESSDIETNHLQVSLPKDLELTLFLLFFSLLLSLNSFNPNYIGLNNPNYVGRRLEGQGIINKILLIKAIIKYIV